MYGWNCGEPQPGPVPKGNFTGVEPHVSRHEVAVVVVGDDRKMRRRRLMRSMGGGGVIFGLV